MLPSAPCEQVVYQPTPRQMSCFLAKRPLTQSIYKSTEAATEIYTDDPCIAVRGDKAHRDFLILLPLVLWLCFGRPLAWKKSARGFIADWIGANFSVRNNGVARGVTVSIKADIFQSAFELWKQVLAQNVVAKNVGAADGQAQQYCKPPSSLATFSSAPLRRHLLRTSEQCTR